MTTHDKWHDLIGSQAQLTRMVADADTAAAVGSGTLAVLGTPVVVAWLEAATLQVVRLPEGSVSLGVRVDVAHLRGSAVGDTVVCTAVLDDVTGRRLTFKVAAVDATGVEIANGTIYRVVVDEQRFLAGLRSG